MATTPNAARSKLVADLKRWTAEAKKIVGRAEVAKRGLRTIKAELKKARKTSKIAKKAAKDARKKLEAMLAGLKQLDAAAARSKAGRAKKPGSARKAAKPTKVVKGGAATPKPDASSKLKPRAKAKASKATAKPAAKTLQSAADVARSVIKRLATDKRNTEKASTSITAPAAPPPAKSAEPKVELTDSASAAT